MSKWGVPAAIKTQPARRGWSVTSHNAVKRGWAVPLNPVGNGARLTRAGAAYDVNSPNRPWSFQALTSGSDRFEVRPYDNWFFDHAIDKERCELANNGGFLPLNTDVWLSFAMKVTATRITAPWTVVGQFRAFDDAGDYAARSPALAQYLYPDTAVDGLATFAIDSRSDTAANSTGNPPTVRRYTNASFTLNVWHTFVYKVKFDPTAGYLATWIDGAVAVAGATIPLGMNDAQGPGWKYGAYRGAGSALPVVVEYANLELGTADLSARITTPLATPP